MTDMSSATPDYTVGFSEEFLQALKRYTAETHAAHLLVAQHLWATWQTAQKHLPGLCPCNWSWGKSG